MSYDHLLQFTTDIGNGVCERFRIDGVVCPPKMRSSVFTSAAVDNIDYNPTSATAKDALHGTGISLIQHLATQSEGHDRGVVIIIESSSNKSISPLPTSYTNVPPAALKTKEFTVPSVQGLVKPADFTTFTKAKEDEVGWLKTVMEALHKEKLDEMEWVSWSAWHANIQNINPTCCNQWSIASFLGQCALGGYDKTFDDSRPIHCSTPQSWSSSSSCC